MSTLELGGEKFPIEVVWRFANGFTFTSVRVIPVPPSKGGIASDGSSRRPVVVQGPTRDGGPHSQVYEAIFEASLD